MTILISRFLFGRLRDLVFRLKLRVGFFRFKNVGECPLCGGAKFRPVSSFTQKFAVIHIEQCVGCELILQNPRLDDQSLLRFYRSIYRRTHLGLKSNTDKTFRSRNFEREVRRGSYIYEYVTKSGFKSGGNMVAEIGCGSGGILTHFQAMEDTVIGCDLDPNTIAYGIEKNLPLEVGSIETLLPYVGSIDLVILSHTLEHVPNVRSFLQDIKTLIAPGGMIYIEVPGVNNPRFTMLRNAQLGHLMYFNLKSLKRLLKTCGFKNLDGNEVVQAIFRVDSIQDV